MKELLSKVEAADVGLALVGVGAAFFSIGAAMIVVGVILILNTRPLRMWL